MQLRRLGKTDLNVSVLGFGCGAVGGLLVKGDRAEMTRTVAYAIENGVNYFDTAALYGNGKSEENLGAVLKELNADVRVGTKVRLATEEFDDIEAAILASVERSLQRLQMESVDLVQLHNLVAAERNPQRGIASVEDVEQAMSVFQDLVKAGKARHWGFNGLGEPAAVRQALHGSAQTVQSAVNLLNATAAMPAPHGFAFEDYGQTINVAAQEDVGVIAIRVLAGG
ncbi:MAG: aldo/keto reductase, partial [Caldilineaceae bacterium]|nr:aldo/keto reductase [Caldilineaceae bacterium]